MKHMSQLDIVALAGIVNNEAMQYVDRVEAAGYLSKKALTSMNGAGWLMLSIGDKAAVRQALKFDVIANGLTA